MVLIDPVAGSKEEAIAVESQAIGRAHRMGQDKQVENVALNKRKVFLCRIQLAMYQVWLEKLVSYVYGWLF